MRHSEKERTGRKRQGESERTQIYEGGVEEEEGKKEKEKGKGKEKEKEKKKEKEKRRRRRGRRRRRDLVLLGEDGVSDMIGFDNVKAKEIVG